MRRMQLMPRRQPKMGRSQPTMISERRTLPNQIGNDQMSLRQLMLVEARVCCCKIYFVQCCCCSSRLDPRGLQSTRLCETIKHCQKVFKLEIIGCSVLKLMWQIPNGLLYRSRLANYTLEGEKAVGQLPDVLLALTCLHLPSVAGSTLTCKIFCSSLEALLSVEELLSSRREFSTSCSVDLYLDATNGPSDCL